MIQIVAIWTVVIQRAAIEIVVNQTVAIWTVVIQAVVIQTVAIWTVVNQIVAIWTVEIQIATIWIVRSTFWMTAWMNYIRAKVSAIISFLFLKTTWKLFTFLTQGKGRNLS